MTKQENLKQIIESMPSDTQEIVHVILKSQAKTKRRKSMM